MKNSSFNAEGGCGCGAVRYRLTRSPIYTHCCHCTWCQRETGSAFAVNALIETDCIETLQGQPQTIHTPSNSGGGQEIVRCPACRIAVWSHYSAARGAIAFVRAGTLDDPSLTPPDIHIFTSTRQAWFDLPRGAHAVEAYYDRRQLWPSESLERYAAAKAAAKA